MMEMVLLPASLKARKLGEDRAIPNTAAHHHHGPQLLHVAGDPQRAHQV